MQVITIILFFIYTWGLGFTLSSLVKNSENSLERNLMRIALGIGGVVVLGVLFNLLHIPLDWKVFLVASLIFPIFSLIKNKDKITSSLKNINVTKLLTRSNLYILIVLLLFAFSFYMYHQGAFSYPYLEDDDPWEHARSVKYISIEKTAYEPSNADKDLFKYIDPYPPGYDILMSILYQTNDSINWTLKFFNALIISLSIIFFYFFVKEFTKNKDKALIATFVLTVIPSYLSHFIWAHSLIPLLFFVAFYCLERIELDQRWTWIAGIVIASIFLVQPTKSIKFVLLFSIYFVVNWLINKKFPSAYFKSILVGGVLSLSWWGTKIGGMFGEANIYAVSRDSGSAAVAGFFGKALSFIKNYFNPHLGSATRPYTFNDFFIAQHSNMINNPIGIGIVLTITALVSVALVLIFFKKYVQNKKAYPIITLCWLILLFLMVNSATFNIPGLFAFRVWMLLAIPVSIIIAEGITLLLPLLKSVGIPKILVLSLFIFGAVFTSGMQKYSVNTAMWPPGASWSSMDEVQLYAWLNNLPKQTKVMSFSGSLENPIIGFDMDNCDWCSEYRDFRKDFINKNPKQTYAFLKSEGYEYLILDSMGIKFNVEPFGNYTQDFIIAKYGEYLNETSMFTGVYQNNGGIILKVN